MACFVSRFLFASLALNLLAAPDPKLYQPLKYRLVGPFRAGRVTAVAGVASQANTYYFGATGGGVFKTTDGGFNWDPVTDGQLGTGSVGALSVCEADPNVLYVGMGEVPIRGNVSAGDGVYRSNDAGRTWARAGLMNTRHIGRIRIHPKNCDIAYASVLGHIFGPHAERGVYRTRDGGKTWEQVGPVRNDHTGAIDLVMDATNPNVLYAGYWDVKRTPWSLESGGPGGGVFKSVNGGDTWTELTRNPGGPKGIVGKIGVTVSPVNPDRVWALIEAEDGGLFRSENGGKTWTRVNEDRNLRQRAWYYTRLYADPVNVDRVYVLNVAFWRSSDGGKTFESIQTPHGDNHDLWIAPGDSQRMIEGNDGGANVTMNGGKSWTSVYNQPTAQFYRVATDQEFPYNIYGAQQDNSTVRIASRTLDAGIDERAWHPAGGGESGWMAPHPKDANVIFAGSYGGLITRYDHRTRQVRNITVWPDNPMGYGAEGMRYRFQWNFPILFSPHDANLLYAAGNRLFVSRNEGQSWQPISPDLTRDDKSKQGPTGGPITRDNTSVEYYCTIFALAESNLTKGLIWTGSDDGLIHVTRDGGQKWDNVTPPREMLPEWIQINSIEASPHQPGTAYVAATMYKHDDFRPYLYKTADFGKTWKKIVNGIPDTAFTRVIREDPARRGLLYAGTETGLYVSFNDGDTWQPLQLNLPVVPITDLTVHAREKDLIVATQGRAFWVLDDLTVLHQAQDDLTAKPFHLFAPESAYRLPAVGGAEGRPSGPVGQNPPSGAVVHFWLKEAPKAEVKLEFLDAAGQLIREDKLKAEAGLSRYVWDLRHADAKTFPGLIMWAGNVRGPRAIPGSYQVRVTADGATQTQPLVIQKDPRVATTPDEYQRQLEVSLQLRDKLSETHQAILDIREIRKQMNAVTERWKDAGILAAAQKLGAQLTAIEEALYQTKNRSNQDPLNYPIKLNNKLAALLSVVQSADAPPTDQSRQLQEELTSAINAQVAKLATVRQDEVPAFNKLVRDASLPAIDLKK
ncbi:MAG: glycosyl hydrolase [Bryobacteraceae bacterium]|nr:glycosyl hydrolase [Bryobacteraceae bacterium]